MKRKKRNFTSLNFTFWIAPKFIGLLIAIISLTCIANYLFFYTYAQLTTTPIEAEVGIVSGSISQVADTQASGGNYIQFGSVPNTNKASIRNDGMVIINGFPRFLFGFVTDSDVGRQGQKLVDDLNLISNAKYNVMHPSITELSDTTGYRSAAPDKGMFTIAQFYQPSLTSTVTALKNDLSIFAWDIGDDFNYPDPKKTPDYYLERKKLVKAANPNHLTFGSGTGVYNARIAEYKDALEILGIQAYPISNHDGYYQSAMQESIAYYLHAREVLPASHSVFALPQTFAWSGGRWPNAQELRNMTFGALVARMNGILYYSFFTEGGYLPNQTALWAEAQKLGENINTLQEPILYGTFSRYDAGNGSKDGTARIHAAFWKYKNVTYVLVLNTATSDKKASIPLPSGVEGMLRPLYDGDTRFGTGLSIVNNALVGNLTSYAVHAYKIEP